MGISPTRKGARQMVSHRHITVNGKLVNIPSYRLKPGDTVSIRGNSQGLDFVKHQVAQKQILEDFHGSSGIQIKWKENLFSILQESKSQNR